MSQPDKTILADLEEFHLLLAEAERLGWHDPASVAAALKAAGALIENLLQTVVLLDAETVGEPTHDRKLQ